MATIYELIPQVMADLGAIGKERENAFHRYKFRGIDDVYNAAHSVLCKHGVFTVPYVCDQSWGEYTDEKGRRTLHVSAVIEYVFWAADGTNVRARVLGEGADSGDKAANKAMASAHKYALLQVFAIPTEDPKDSENESPVLSGEKTSPADVRAMASTIFPGSKVTSNEPVITDEEREALKAHFKRLGWALPHASNWLRKHYGVDAPGLLPAAKYEACIAELEAAK